MSMELGKVEGEIDTGRKRFRTDRMEKEFV